MNQREAKQAAIDDALRQIDGGDAFINRRDVKELPSLLLDGELPRQVIDCRLGNTHGTMFSTDHRLLFVSKRMLELRVSDFYYIHIANVDDPRYWLMFSAGFTMLINGTTVPVSHVSRDRVTPFVNWVRARVAELQRQAAAPSSAHCCLVADELEKLVALREPGALTKT
jgi:hypothetical protein